LAILIVDDHPDQREMYASYFTARGFRAFTAADGRSAITAAQIEHPDVIVMDLSLPHIDGWEAMRRLKDDPATADIPIIACTAHMLGTACERAVDAGCNAYVTKPCLPVQLFAEVKRVLGQRAA
jgi:two-component system cell cycle response regulator DivK